MTIGDERIEAILPLTPAQQGVVYQSLVSEGPQVYYHQWWFTLRGPLDVEAFESAWQRVVDRHAALRTVFVAKPGKRPVQAIYRRLPIAVYLVDWSGRSAGEQDRLLDEFFERDEERGFDLSRPPLTRLTLMRRSERCHEFVWSSHHVQTDAWSVFVVFDEVLTFYWAAVDGRAVEPAAPPSYAGFVRWVDRRDEGESERFWRDALAGFQEPVPVPLARRRSGDEVEVRHRELQAPMDETAMDDLRGFATAHGLTVGTLLYGAWAILLARLTGHYEPVFGATVSGRPIEIENIDSMVGMLINTLPLRVPVDVNEELVPWLRKVQDSGARMRQHEHSSLARVREVCGLRRDERLFETVVVVQNLQDRGVRERSTGGALEIEEHANRRPRREVPLLLEATPARTLSLHFGYHEPPLDGRSVARLAHHLQVLLREMVRAPSRPVGDLPLLDAGERAELVAGWSAPPVAGAGGRLHDLVWARAAETPDAIAVEAGERSLTYGELTRRAEALASRLRVRGCRRESRIGLFLERSPEAVVAMLAVLRAGGAYVPCDPRAPARWIATAAERAGMRLAVAAPGPASRRLTELGIETLAPADDRTSSPGAVSDIALEAGLIYLLFTSGTTGEPKAVAVTHEAAVHYTLAVLERLELDGTATFATSAPLTADLGNTSVFGALASGGRLVLIPEKDLDLEATADLLATRRVDCLKIVPSHFAALLQVAAPERVVPRRRLVLGGEALPVELAATARELVPGCRVLNHYGPTEATVGVLAAEVPAEPTDPTAPLGRPLAGARVFVAMPGWSPAPPGAPGELHLGGTGLARGYEGDPALTAARFLPDPEGSTPGARVYRTGDRVRPTADGGLEFLGRVDHQVKVRGVRVEPDGVAAQIETHPDVRRAVVLGVSADSLVAVVVPRRGRGPTLDGHERAALPNGMAVVEQNRRETDYLYRHIFEERGYLRHGIGLPERPTVVDVGANIGMFSLLVAALRPEARILAVEPLPPVYEALRLNTELYAPEAETLALGLSDRSGRARFAHYPEYTVMSGLEAYADPDREREIVRRFAGPDAEGLDGLLEERFEAEGFDCPLARLSDLLEERGVERVDLLKIDVQRAELDVLRGIDDGHWPAIRQVVVEVHDRTEGESCRLDTVRALLAERGFEVEVEQEEALRGSELFTLFARRPEAGAETRDTPEKLTFEPPLSPRDLLDHLAERVPEAAMPSRVVFMETLPLTATGKVDRAALLRSDAVLAEEPGDALDGDAPEGELEEGLAAIWGRVLQRPSVPARASFFEIGGHSLLAMQMILMVRRELDVEIGLRAFLAQPTVRGLSREIVRLQLEAVDEGVLEELLGEARAKEDGPGGAREEGGRQ